MMRNSFKITTLILLIAVSFSLSKAESQDAATPLSGIINTGTTPIQAETTVEPMATPFAGPGEGLESAVSSQAYRVGPGDRFTINIWGPEPVTYQLQVTLEGKILIPKVGELNVSGLQLSEAQALITNMLFKHFRQADIAVSLTGLRRFQVHVLGQVRRPGTYLATAVDRVSAAVNWATGFQKTASQRKILVMNSDSVRAEVDLFAFFQQGDPQFNPRLRDGDIVYVPFSSSRFTVMGSVNNPGSVEFLEHDLFSTALYYAGGFTSEAFFDTIEIARYQTATGEPERYFATTDGRIIAANAEYNSAKPEILGTFEIKDAILDNGQHPKYPEFELQSDDIIFVRSVPEYRLKRLVEVTGEVVYPGFYPIDEGETRVSNIIMRAGGLTQDAFLFEAQLIRREAIRLEDKEFERLKDVPRSEMTDDEYEYFKLKSRENPGLMFVDFHKLLAQGDDKQDLLLQRGDLIDIPTRKNFISVLGMVRSPGNIIYDQALKPSDYIDRVGGYAENADTGRARVIKAGSGEWISLKSAKMVEPGDTIWIPEKRDRNYWETFKEALVVTTQIIAFYLIVDRAINK